MAVLNSVDFMEKEAIFSWETEQGWHASDHILFRAAASSELLAATLVHNSGVFIFIARMTQKWRSRRGAMPGTGC
jgi:hypothetical protein